MYETLRDNFWGDLNQNNQKKYGYSFLFVFYLLFICF